MIGKVLGNRYEIVEKVGGGGMALVYKAKCRLLNRYVAIKILRPEFTNDEDFIKKFRRESQAAASLSHPNIVNIYDTGVEDNIYYIVMEYIAGKTLKELIREKGKLNPEDTINIATQIAEALNHAHRNHIVHRDIKPHNILVTDDGRIKVTDFGIARAATSSTVTNTGNVIGSVHYFSPEQARGGYTDEKSDIYSLGIVMYEMITGRVPFEGDSPISVALKHVQEDMVPPSVINNTIPKNIEKIIMKAVEKDQTLRYNNAVELLKDLKKVELGSDNESIEFKDYTDSPTRVIPAVKDDMIMEKEKNKKKKKEKKQSKNTRTIVTVAAVLLALALATGIGMIGYNYLKSYIIGQEIEVPNLIRLQEDIARKKAEDLGLEFVVKYREFNSDYTEGHIIKQTPKPGVTRKEGSPIEVVVSKGQRMVKVPDLINKYSYELDILLSDADLIEGNTTYKHSETIPRNIVISQNPKPDSMVPEGSKVDIVISKGPEINYILMPSLIGKDIEEAKKDIIVRGFSVGDIIYKPSEEYQKNIVIEQGYPAGSEVEENTPINLVVSSGPKENETTTEQNNGNEEMNQSEEQNENQNSIEEQKSVQFLIKLPKEKDEVEVRIIKITDNTKELVYNKKHKASEEEIIVNLKGTKGTKFEVYIDGEFKGQKEI
ncbi:Stk1 family PASTA domain-containing Ser/Thr kinase [Caldisalinibacter kiritimatiensis]|uniref:non-specific serine/threonine protein kinase n=1 Tax=Caldisalinibacter kiritimatiensis TaxID=1304284 RepID=R1CG76_9FIRM|nr:Stk1 family PASTA domain-containing Ser/Thr kinase [Caldisalinibacter kiritimatiensis]EOD01320.1 Serine/threonine protein kinase PrkC, regulator of stationary phase [Caldisalinibacter kiritimatiensis]